MENRTYINWADEVAVPHQDVGHKDTENYREDPSPNETFNSLFGRQFDKLSTSKRDSTYIGEDIVGNYKRCGKEEPDHALEYVIHDKVGLDYNQVEGHMCPCKLRELKSVVAFFQRSNKKDKT